MPILTTSIENTLERVRRALGERAPGRDEDLVVRGRAEFMGAAGTFTWRFGPRGTFLRAVEGELARTMGADERGAWIHQGGGPARDLEWGDADRERLLTAVLAGEWLAPASGVEITAVTDGRLRLAFGRAQGVLTLDASTFEPRELELQSSFERVWAFADFVSHDGIRLPRHVEQRLPASAVNRFRVTSVTREPSRAASFTRPVGSPGTHFDPSLPAEVPVERSSNGFLLVNLDLDGREVGPFIFDTGAGTNVITPQAADSLGLPRIGAGWLGLAAGAARGAVRRAGRMRLGPLTIEKPAFTEMDLSPVSAVSGARLAGILGYEVLRRAVAEVEAATPRLALHDPGMFCDGDEVPWQPIAIYGNHVYARGRVEGHEGWFRLDTGAPQVPLIFNGPAVERLALLEGREVSKAQIGVPGGTMDVAIGKVGELELAGHSLGSMAAIFPLQSSGAFADRETIGNLGQECFYPFRVTFDYTRGRAAFRRISGS